MREEEHAKKCVCVQILCYLLKFGVGSIGLVLPALGFLSASERIVLYSLV